MSDIEQWRPFDPCLDDVEIANFVASAEEEVSAVLSGERRVTYTYKPGVIENLFAQTLTTYTNLPYTNLRYLTGISL